MDRPDSPLLGFTDCPPSPDPLAHPSPTFTRFLPSHLPPKVPSLPPPPHPTSTLLPSLSRHSPTQSRHNPHSHSLPAPPRQPMTPFLHRSPSSFLRTPDPLSSPTRRSLSRSSAPHSASSRHAVYIPDSVVPTPVWLSAPSSSRDKPSDLDDYTFPARVDSPTTPTSPAHHLELELPNLDDIRDLFTFPTPPFKSISAPASTATSRPVSPAGSRSHSAHPSTVLLPDYEPPSPTTPTASTVSLLTISTPDTSPYSPRLRDDDDSSIEARAEYPCVSRWSLSTCSQDQATPPGGIFPSSSIIDPILGFRRHTVEKERGRVKERVEKPKSAKRKTLASFIARLSGAPIGWGSILNPRPDIEPALLSAEVDQEPKPASPVQPTYEFPTISVGHSRPTSPAPTTPLWLGRSLKSDAHSMCSLAGVAALPEEARARASTLSGVSAGLGGLSRGIGNRSSSALSLITFGGGIGKKKTLIVTGLKRDDKRGYEAVRAWCEGFGQLRNFSQKSNGNLYVEFRKSSVADTVCRVQAQVYIRGAGSVSLSWSTKKSF